MAFVSNNVDKCSFCSNTCNEEFRHALVPSHHQEQKLKIFLQKLSSFTTQLSSYPTCDKCHQELITVHNFPKSCFLISPSIEPTAIKMEPELMVDDHKQSDNENILETDEIEDETESQTKDQNGELLSINEIDGEDDNSLIIPVARTKTQRKGERSHPCPHCSKACSNIANLKQHILTHTGERPYSCSQCPKVFRQSSSLKKHIRTHTGDRPYPCSQCSKAFICSSALDKHNQSHADERPHSCPHCPSAFRNRYALRMHIKTHTGERPYPCPHCTRAFSDNSNLKQHIRTHTE
ncbi:zinc finger protein 431-like isoform X2 [Toxorhynchites rutilus septentrionalis]|uniref:zinc finger protein 431-like isoform X2 n=1 Tax=Toxorhynchites rutilus septentrionalis TaxID=329112 RepID=UPI002479C053|nr:zinc finger protein 431-like isoform X2 [Toxorhynchites rutilus septentrionalis]